MMAVVPHLLLSHLALVLHWHCSPVITATRQARPGQAPTHVAHHLHLVHHRQPGGGNSQLYRVWSWLVGWFVGVGIDNKKITIIGVMRACYCSAAQIQFKMTINN